MRHPTSEELMLAQRLRKMTGKKLRTCIFCIQITHGDFARAVEFCSDDTSEDGR